MAPDDVVEHRADVLRLVQRSEDGVHRRRPDVVAALHQLDELVDHGTRFDDARLLAFDRQAVPAQPDRAVEAVAQRVEHAVPHTRQLGGDFVGNVEDLLHAPSVGGDETMAAVRG